VQHEVERAHVRRFVAFDDSVHHGTEVLLHARRGDLAHDQRVGRVVVGEERNVRDVAFVAGAVATELAQCQPRHQGTSSSTTCTSGST
jgi:hypothetical protein